MNLRDTNAVLMQRDLYVAYVSIWAHETKYVVFFSFSFSQLFTFANAQVFTEMKMCVNRNSVCIVQSVLFNICSSLQIIR